MLLATIRNGAELTTIYHNPRCSKSRAALELLEARGLQFEVIKYLDTPPTAQRLGEIVKMLGIKAEQIVRKKEKLYGELELDDKTLSEKEWLVVLAAHPQLIERPIVVHHGKAAIGRPTEKISDILDG